MKPFPDGLVCIFHWLSAYGSFCCCWDLSIQYVSAPTYGRCPFMGGLRLMSTYGRCPLVGVQLFNIILLTVNYCNTLGFHRALNNNQIPSLSFGQPAPQLYLREAQSSVNSQMSHENFPPHLPDRKTYQSQTFRQSFCRGLLSVYDLMCATPCVHLFKMSGAWKTRFSSNRLLVLMAKASNVFNKQWVLANGLYRLLLLVYQHGPQYGEQVMFMC